jgi:hypothetical protein
MRAPCAFAFNFIGASINRAPTLRLWAPLRIIPIAHSTTFRARSGVIAAGMSQRAAAKALAAIAEGISKGQLLPEEAGALTATVSTFIKALEVTVLEERLSALEKANAESRQSTASRYDA